MSIPFGHGIVCRNDKTGVTVEFLGFQEGSPGSFSDVATGVVLVGAVGLANWTGDTSGAKLRPGNGGCLVRNT